MASFDDHDELRDLSGAYALDALGDLERVRFERHLGTCDECTAEVSDFFATTRLLAVGLSVAPPPAMRTAVLAGISGVRQLPPQTVPGPRRSDDAVRVPEPDDERGLDDGPGVVRIDRRRRRLGSILVAAALALVVGIGISVTRPWQDDPSQTNVADAVIQRVLAAPDATRVQQSLGGGTATVVRSASVGRAVVMVQGVTAPTDRVYQLWLLRGTVAASAGLLTGDADQTRLLEGDAATAQAAAITVEPEGGSASPTTTPTVFEFPQA